MYGLFVVFGELVLGVLGFWEIDLRRFSRDCFFLVFFFFVNLWKKKKKKNKKKKKKKKKKTKWKEDFPRRDWMRILFILW